MVWPDNCRASTLLVLCRLCMLSISYSCNSSHVYGFTEHIWAVLCSGNYCLAMIIICIEVQACTMFLTQDSIVGSVPGAIYCSRYCLVCFQSSLIFCWQTGASHLIAHCNPVVVQIVLAAKDFKVLAWTEHCHPSNPGCKQLISYCKRAFNLLLASDMPLQA